MKQNYLFTSESVSAGHPDKVSDQISDAILDEFLRQDPNSKVACETLCTTGLVVVAGEVKSNAYVDVQGVVRKTIADIGYNNAEYGFEASSCGVLSAIHEQSSDIRLGVEKPINMMYQQAEAEGQSCKEINREFYEDAMSAQGAGDQGIMFGYAVRETAEFMPATLALSHLLLQELDAIRKESGGKSYLRPDAKSQVTIEYDEFGKPLRVDTIVVSTQHDECVTDNTILQHIKECLIPRVKAKDPQLAELFQDDYRLLVNPTGRFVIGGHNGDTGVTGRKIIVDTYGGRACHGGGAFSGKDSSKVDRSAAYMARYIAKNLVAAGVADEVQVQLAYAIGVAKPVSVAVNTFGTADVAMSDGEIASRIAKLFDLRPAVIVERFGLKNPIYLPTASYGHFGRQPYTVDGIEFFGWERLDAVPEIKQTFNLD
ncbi:S-adenosylmethionine synthetase [Mucinivorans hirudinis]|uniref:S-adenosylmethionine synthase n=1 Tax=Mucinivorans hirudinis TaxID=1433126 RepID=A0A060R6E4_9BACT|nr:S-adenosylmethionine synthetase [Mucinivorans hirudinis]